MRISVLLHNALNGDVANTFTLDDAEPGKKLYKLVTDKLAPTGHMCQVLMPGGEFLLGVRSLRAQGIEHGSTLSYLVKKGTMESWLGTLREQISNCLFKNNDVSYDSLIIQLSMDEKLLLVNSTTDVQSCLRRIVEVGSTRTHSYLLCHAARVGAHETRAGILGIRELIRSGLDINKACPGYREEGGSALHVAMNWSRPVIAKALMEAHADAKQVDASGDIPLHKAALCMAQMPSIPHPCMPQRGDLTNDAVFDVVRLFLEHQADINHRGFRGETPLLRACSESLPTLVRFFIDKRADVNIKDVDQKCPLHHAAKRQNAVAALTLLLDAAAIVNVFDGDLKTPLMVAVEASHSDCVFKLLHKGASVNEHTLEVAVKRACERPGKLEMETLMMTCEGHVDVYEGCKGALMEIALESNGPGDETVHEFLESFQPQALVARPTQGNAMHKQKKERERKRRREKSAGSHGKKEKKKRKRNDDM